MRARFAFRRDKRGSVALEAALMISLVLVPLTLAVVGAGQIIATQMRLDRALHAAMLFAWATPAATKTAVEAAALAGYGAGNPPLTASAPIECFCMLATSTRQSGTAASCSGTCLTGFVMGVYVTPTLTATVDVTVPWLTGISKLRTSTGTTRLR